MNTHTPAPGPELKNLTELLNRFEIAVDLASKPGKPEEGKDSPDWSVDSCFGAILEKLQSDNVSLDGMKILLDRFESVAEYKAQISNQYLLQATWNQEAAKRLTQYILEGLQKAGKKKAAGETWAVEVQESQPQMKIDQKVLFEKGQRFMVQVPMLDEKKLLAALAEGEKVEGIELVPAPFLAFSVRKKAGH